MELQWRQPVETQNLASHEQPVATWQQQKHHEYKRIFGL